MVPNVTLSDGQARRGGEERGQGKDYCYRRSMMTRCSIDLYGYSWKMEKPTIFFAKILCPTFKLETETVTCWVGYLPYTLLI